MTTFAEILNRYRHQQIEAVAAGTGVLNGNAAQLIESITAHQDNPAARIEDVIAEDVFAADEAFAGGLLSELMDVWANRLEWQQKQDNILLSQVQAGLAALAVDCRLDGDVNSWDMNHMALVGQRVTSDFETNHGTVYAFDEGAATWVANGESLRMDQEGFPVDASGARLAGKFVA